MDIETLSINLTAFLTGYAGADPRRLDFIQACTDWPYMAHDAIHRRRAQFLESLDLATLEAIATHKLNLSQIAATLSETL